MRIWIWIPNSGVGQKSRDSGSHFLGIVPTLVRNWIYARVEKQMRNKQEVKSNKNNIKETEHNVQKTKVENVDLEELASDETRKCL